MEFEWKKDVRSGRLKSFSSHSLQSRRTSARETIGQSGCAKRFASARSHRPGCVELSFGVSAEAITCCALFLEYD